MAKCKPSTICFSKYIFYTTIIIILCVAYLLWKNTIKYYNNNTNSNNTYTNKNNSKCPDVTTNNNINTCPTGIPYEQNWGIPPLRNTYAYNLPRINSNIGAVQVPYTQLGMLTPINAKNNIDGILPLMGRPVNLSRNKWQYYTATSNQQNSIKLQVIVNKKDCMNEQGCDNLYNRDKVFVTGLKNQYVVTLYETNTYSYNNWLI